MNELDTDLDLELEMSETEVEVDPTLSFVDALQSGNFAGAETLFNDILGNKVQDALDAEKVAVADQIFNSVEPEEMDLDDEVEVDDTDSIDLELEETEES
jgi:hypothetical protein